MYWKVLKKNLASCDIFVSFARDAFRQAYEQGLIDDEAVWLQMLDDHNDFSHTYREDLAEELFEHIKIAVVVMDTAYQKLKLLSDKEV